MKMKNRFQQNVRYVFFYMIQTRLIDKAYLFSVKIVCLIDIYFYFCHSLLSSEGSSFLIILLRTVIYYISLQKNPLIFFLGIVISVGSHASFVYILCYILNWAWGYHLCIWEGSQRIPFGGRKQIVPTFSFYINLAPPGTDVVIHINYVRRL